MRRAAPVLMVLGTASSVGKSLMVAGLARMFRRRGFRVAPFKAQNMALNSYVTKDGREIGRAQAMQAEAAGVECHAWMNPVLLKPEGDRRSQVVVLGEVMGAMDASSYHRLKPQLRETILSSLEQLRQHYDLVIIEGAGSPAEINLKSQDIVNMFVAKSANAPCILVGDIDRGGIFASFVGTLALLDQQERDLIKGFVVNKFRGDLSLLTPGYKQLFELTGKPVLGTLSYLKGLRISEEDSLGLQGRSSGWLHGRESASLDIAIIRLPRLSNYDEFDALEHEEDVVVRYVYHPRQLKGAHLVIVPGSKQTIQDLRWLRERGFEAALKRRAEAGQAILGICGGCQILGHEIDDGSGVEGQPDHEVGLGLIPLKTVFRQPKTTTRLEARLCHDAFGLSSDEVFHGYEIHMGQLHPVAKPGRFGLFQIQNRNGQSCEVIEGGVGANGKIWGTLIHGLFENQNFRLAVINQLRAELGLEPLRESRGVLSREKAYDRLAEQLEGSLDLKMLCQWIGIKEEHYVGNAANLSDHAP